MPEISTLSTLLLCLTVASYIFYDFATSPLNKLFKINIGKYYKGITTMLFVFFVVSLISEDHFVPKEYKLFLSLATSFILTIISYFIAYFLMFKSPIVKDKTQKPSKRFDFVIFPLVCFLVNSVLIYLQLN